MSARLPFPDPTGLEFAPWGAVVAEQLAVFGILAPYDDTNWQDWAASLLYAPELAAFPEPYGFADWREWARRLLETTY